MKRDRETRGYRDDILDATRKAMHFTAGMDFAAFQGDEKTSYAVVRALEVVGEATKRLPEDLRRCYPDLPWRDMAGMRDKLIHDYSGVDLEVVWKVVVEDLPLLEVRLSAIVADLARGQGT